MSEPNAGLGGPVPRLDMRYRASSRRREFVETGGCLICGAGNAGLVETSVGIFRAWRLYGGSAETYGNMTRMGIRGAWGSAIHGLQCMACEMWDCGLQFFMNSRRATDAYGGRLCRPTATPCRSRWA